MRLLRVTQLGLGELVERPVDRLLVIASEPGVEHSDALTLATEPQLDLDYNCLDIFEKNPEDTSNSTSIRIGDINPVYTP